MTVKTSYQPGQPIWVDLSSPDLDASRAFYGALFGWNAPPGLEEFGGYANFELDGRKVAGLMPMMAPGQPPTWSCYVCTDDAAKTTALVEQAGGTVIAPPMDVADLGRMAVYTDAGGAFFGVWQPGGHLGAELTDQEGALTWIELGTRDKARAYSFYETVFGWTTQVSPDYTEFQLAGTSTAGCTDVPPDVPAEVPGYWMPYFAASDPGAQAAEAERLGGTVVAPVTDFGDGRFAVVQDPNGATFGLLDLKERA